jgi:hypothetical protein
MTQDEFTHLSGAVALLVSAVIHTVQILKAAKLKKQRDQLGQHCTALFKRLGDVPVIQPPKES